MKILNLNHVALAVSDVPASIAFYENVVGLQKKPRPDFDFDGAWFALGDTQELHLLEGLNEKVNDHPRGNHFAVEIDDFDACREKLESNGAKVVNINIRPDGARQIFIEDPDGHVMEFCYLAGL